VARHRRERLPEQRSHLDGELRPHRRVALDEVREPREHDAAHDAFRQGLAEGAAGHRRLRRQRRASCVVEPQRGALAEAGRDPVDDEVRPPLEQGEEGRPRLAHPLERRRRNLDRLSVPCHALERLEPEVEAGREDDGHVR